MSQDNFPDWFPESHIDNAEAIRAYLVSIRGGAPFLSGADCRLLIQWLDEDIPVPTILTTIDRVSAQRRQKRVRSRLSLSICKGTLNRLIGKKKPSPTQSIEETGINHWIESIQNMPISDALLEARQELVSNIRQVLKSDGLELSQKASEMISACCSFLDAAWELAFDEQIELQHIAESELSALKSLLHGHAWKDAVEEVMRDHVRQRYPLINAQAVWNALNQ